MQFASRFTPDPARLHEFVACLWQGPVPPGVRFERWRYLQTTPPSILLLWEAADDGERSWVEALMNDHGCTFETVETTDGTVAMQAALDRDLDGFAEWMRAQGASERRIDGEVALRRVGRDAPSREAAVDAARAWAAGGHRAAGPRS